MISCSKMAWMSLYMQCNILCLRTISFGICSHSKNEIAFLKLDEPSSYLKSFFFFHLHVNFLEFKFLIYYENENKFLVEQNLVKKGALWNLKPLQLWSCTSLQMYEGLIRHHDLVFQYSPHFPIKASESLLHPWLAQQLQHVMVCPHPVPLEN